MRRNKAATRLQAAVRGYLACIKYQKLKKTVLGIQRLGRGVLARRRFLAMKRNKAVSYFHYFVNFFYCSYWYKIWKRLYTFSYFIHMFIKKNLSIK